MNSSLGSDGASYKILLGAFALVPFIAFVAPRFLAYWPAIVGLLSMLYFVGYQKKCPKIDFSLICFIMAPVLLGGGSLLWAQSFDVSAERVQKMGLLLFGGGLFFASIQFYRPPSVSVCVKLFSPLVSLMCVLVVFELSFNFPFYRLTHEITDVYGRVMPAVYNRGSIVLLFVGMIIFCLAVRSNMYLYAVLNFLSLLLLCLYSDSQSLQLAFVVGALALLVFPYRSAFGWGLAWLFIAVLTLSALHLSMWMFSHAVNVSSNAFMAAGSAGPRLEIWDYVSRYAMDSPWFGYGIEVTRSIEDFDSNEVFQGGTSILHPHNFAVQFWIEFGLFGVGLLLCYFALLFRRLATNCTNSLLGRACFPTFIMFLTISSIGYGVWQSWWLGLILLVSAFVHYVSRPSVRL